MNFKRSNVIHLTEKEREILEKAYYVIVDIQDYLDETNTCLLTNNSAEINNDDLDFINENLNLLFLDTNWEVE